MILIIPVCGCCFQHSIPHHSSSPKQVPTLPGSGHDLGTKNICMHVLPTSTLPGEPSHINLTNKGSQIYLDIQVQVSAPQGVLSTLHTVPVRHAPSHTATCMLQIGIVCSRSTWPGSKLQGEKCELNSCGHSPRGAYNTEKGDKACQQAIPNGLPMMTEVQSSLEHTGLQICTALQRKRHLCCTGRVRSKLARHPMQREQPSGEPV